MVTLPFCVCLAWLLYGLYKFITLHSIFDLELGVDEEMEELLKKYRDRMEEMVNFKAVKCIFSGPPRVGKTTVKRRLLKEIINLRSHVGLLNGSTTVDSYTVPIYEDTSYECAEFSESLDEWKHLDELLDEGWIVVNLPKHIPPQEQQNDLPTILLPGDMLPEESSVVSPTDDTSLLASTPSEQPNTYTKLKEAGRDLYRQIMESRSDKTPRNITTLYILDTGGQPECHDILPLILRGPALHLVVFNLAKDLDKPVTVQYCQKTGTDAYAYTSQYTSINMLHQILSSLYSLKCTESETDSTGSVVVLVGTHKDLLKDSQEESIGKKLKESFIDSDFVKENDFLRCPESQEGMFFSMDNMDGDEKEICDFRKFLSCLIQDDFNAIEIPMSWLIFHLALRKHPGGIVTIQECEALAEGCYIDKEDVKKVLMYLHLNLGTLLYYDLQSELENVVISDPRVLFHALAELIAVSFTGKRGSRYVNDTIRIRGIVPDDRIRHILSKGSSQAITGKYLIALLEHLNIMVKLPESEGYFLPCLLKPEPKGCFPKEGSLVHNECTPQELAATPSPLLIKFDGGYIPLGLFSAVIVALSREWKVNYQCCYRNHVRFITYSADVIVRNSYLEVQVRCDLSDHHKTHNLCSKVRKTVVNALKEIEHTHRHTKAKFQLGFYCPNPGQEDHSSVSPHFLGCYGGRVYDTPETVECTNRACKYFSSDIQKIDNYAIWFDNWQVYMYLLGIAYSMGGESMKLSLHIGSEPIISEYILCLTETYGRKFLSSSTPSRNHSDYQ